jgi:hypothetical protein
MKITLLLLTVVGLSGCAASNQVCEDVTEVAEQMKACEILQHQIAGLSNHPLMKTELERRYQKECTEMRYYRSDKNPVICQNKDNKSQK